MAQHNPQSRSYLLIVLGAIAVGFTIAVLFLGGGESEKATDGKGEHQAQSAGAASGESTEGASGHETAPGAPGEDEGMTDDMSPPDEMMDEPLLDEAPDEIEPGQSAEEPAPEEPAPSQNP